MRKWNLPVNYELLSSKERREVREQYVLEQNGKCYWCHGSLQQEPGREITDKVIDWSLFPEGFLKHPIHLQHNHDNDMTEGAVHAYCNAVMWQYHGR